MASDQVEQIIIEKEIKMQKRQMHFSKKKKKLKNALQTNFPTAHTKGRRFALKPFSWCLFFYNSPLLNSHWQHFTTTLTVAVE